MADERPPVDPELLLASWMQWEKGSLTPGKVMSELKRGGLRELLESAALARQELAAG
ncbi:MAG: hypothetical protein ABIW46_09795 [Acidimicrobiales bacterium]